MKIFVDFDGVLNNLHQVWIAELNRKYHYSVVSTETTEYDMEKIFPELNTRQIYDPYLSGMLYYDIAPPKDAQEVIRQMASKHDVYILTANMFGVKEEVVKDYIEDGFNARVFYNFVRAVWELYPDIPLDHIILAADKSSIKGDIIIDDNPENLINNESDYRILLDAPYNQFIEVPDGITRVSSWTRIRKIYNLIEDMNTAIENPIIT